MQIMVWKRNNVRKMTVVALVSAVALLLTGCREIPNNPSVYQSNVKDHRDWQVRALWTWGQAGEAVTVIRGLGKWRNEGETFEWREQLHSTAITTKVEGDRIVIEDGSSFSANSPEGRQRVERSMFTALDPIALAVRHGVSLSVENDTLTGSAPCKDYELPCMFKIDIKVDSQKRPIHARVEISRGELLDTIDWTYESESGLTLG